MDRSDVCLIGFFTAPKHVASLTVSLTNGEGARAVERNNGRAPTALLVVYSLAVTGGDPDKLSLSLMGRDGSPASTRPKTSPVTTQPTPPSSAAGSAGALPIPPSSSAAWSRPAQALKPARSLAHRGCRARPPCTSSSTSNIVAP